MQLLVQGHSQTPCEAAASLQAVETAEAIGTAEAVMAPRGRKQQAVAVELRGQP